MAVVVVGGHTRNIGKTSVVAGLIAAMPELRWTAVKITQFGHGICSANGEACDCETADHTIAVSEERDAATGTDSSRYLAAGAAKAFWVRTRQGQLAEAMPRVRRLISDAEHVIIESNSVLRFLKPDVSLSVLDPQVADFKPSAMRYLDRVDGVIMPLRYTADVRWLGISLRLLRAKRHFVFTPPSYCTAELCDFVRSRVAETQKPSGDRMASIS